MKILSKDDYEEQKREWQQWVIPPDVNVMGLEEWCWEFYCFWDAMIEQMVLEALNG